MTMHMRVTPLQWDGIGWDGWDRMGCVYMCVCSAYIYIYASNAPITSSPSSMQHNQQKVFVILYSNHGLGTLSLSPSLSQIRSDQIRSDPCILHSLLCSLSLSLSLSLSVCTTRITMRELAHFLSSY